MQPPAGLWVGCSTPEWRHHPGRLWDLIEPHAAAHRADERTGAAGHPGFAPTLTSALFLAQLAVGDVHSNCASMGMAQPWRSAPGHAASAPSCWSMHVTLGLAAAWFWLTIAAMPRDASWRAIFALLVTGKLFCLLGALLVFAPNVLFGSMATAHHGHPGSGFSPGRPAYGRTDDADRLPAQLCGRWESCWPGAGSLLSKREASPHG